MIPYKYLLIPTVAGALSISYTHQIISAIEDNDLLLVFPLLALTLYLGIISGYIPSPLYDSNKKWPREYAVLQLAFVVLTASRLTRHHQGSDSEIQEEEKGEDYYEYKNDLEELSEFTSWMNTNLHKLFYHEKGTTKLYEDVLPEIIYIVGCTIVASMVNRSEYLRKLDDTTLPMPIVFLRNTTLLIVCNIWFIYESLTDPESETYELCQREFNITPDLIAPDYPMSQLTTEFSEKWKVFHPSHLTWVRLSHSIIYPSILLLLTRRRLSLFAIWLLFIEVDFFHVIADMFHYVADPALAEERLEFQSTRIDCYVNVQVVQTMLAYPLNFVYLTTSWGDTVSGSRVEDA